MKFNYKQMVDTFGKKYTYQTYPYKAHIQEKFSTSLGENFQQADTLEKAIENLKIKIESERLIEIQRIEYMKNKFNNLPFLKRLVLRIRNKKLNFDPTTEEMKNKYIFKKIDITMIDQSVIYTVNSPKIIQDKDCLYVVVTDKNSLNIGIYNATVTFVNYIIKPEGVVNFIGTLSINHNNEIKDFEFSCNEKEYKSRHAYHNIFTDKDKAIDFHNENMRTRIKDIEQQIINLDSVPQNKLHKCKIK